MKNSKLMRAHRLRKRIAEQRAWIERCEASGVSYASTEPSRVMPGLTRGEAIRKADHNELARLEAALKEIA